VRAEPLGPSAAGHSLDQMAFGRMHALIAALCAFGLAIDIGELALNSAFSTLFADRLAFVPKDMQAILLGSVFAGGILGAPLFGLIADLYGRRIALQLSMLLVAAPSILAAGVSDPASLIGLRFLSGIALGAYPPLMTAWLTDILPPAGRARTILLVDAAGFLGAPLVLFTVYWLNSHQPGLVEGWRAVLGGAGFWALVCAFAFAFVPESPRWLEARGRHDEAMAALARFQPGLAAVPRPAGEALAAAAPVPTRLWSGPLRPRLALLFGLYMLRPAPTIAFPILMGLVLRMKGLDPSTSMLLVAASSFGGTAGTLLASTVVERLERRRAITVCGLVMVASAVVFYYALVPAVLFAACACFILFSTMYGPLLSIYASEIFPTPVRGRATAYAWGLARCVSSLLPLVLMPLLATAGIGAYAAVIIASILASIALLLAFGPAQLARRAIA
jgi:putative MFS transporter